MRERVGQLGAEARLERRQQVELAAGRGRGGSADCRAFRSSYSWAMCAQCMATAAAAVGGASGLRAWLVTKGFAWLTPSRQKALTAVLVVTAVLVSAMVSGSGT